MMQATYIGKQKFLQGKTALIERSQTEGFVRAQFDDLTLPLHLTHNWTNHLTTDFDVSVQTFLMAAKDSGKQVQSFEDHWREHIDQYAPQFNR